MRTKTENRHLEHAKEILHRLIRAYGGDKDLTIENCIDIYRQANGLVPRIIRHKDSDIRSIGKMLSTLCQAYDGRIPPSKGTQVYEQAKKYLESVAFA